MRVLLIAAEFAPLAKVGGLGDVVGELPYALKSLGVDVRVYIPFHQTIERDQVSDLPKTEVLVPSNDGNRVAKVYRVNVDGLEVFLIDGDPIASTMGIYSNPIGDGYKFTFFSLAALEVVKSEDWGPHILHAHDWHTSPAVAWMNKNRERDRFWEETATLLTVHNLAYMGVGADAAMAEYGLGCLNDPRLPEWAQYLPLPMGLATADWINAVSPTYAQEIQTPDFGHGLEGLITERKDRVVGILNGIDLSHWDPGTDHSLSFNFNRKSLAQRAKGGRWLRETLQLPIDPEIPLLSVISRLDYQKGIDIAYSALSDLLEESWLLVLLGTGDPSLEAIAVDFETSNPDRVRSIIRFDSRLARRIYAGADMILIPSRYEPCGLTQMIAMRYGCVPIVAGTGGLKDTVTDYRETSKGTGFIFEGTEGESLSDAIRAALRTYGDKRRWRGLQLRGMAQDFSWHASAQKYLELYEKAHQERLGMAESARQNY